jgi:hypothetical protein
MQIQIALRFRAALAFATLDFRELRHELGLSTVDVVCNCAALRVHAEAIDPLLAGAHPQVTENLILSFHQVPA